MGVGVGVGVGRECNGFKREGKKKEGIFRGYLLCGTNSNCVPKLP